jgi:hypothetical protein
LITDPKTLEERNKVAKDFVKDFKVSLPVLVDTLDDAVNKAYFGWPDRLYVIDAAGKLAYVGSPGPGGFKPGEIPPVLNRLLGRTVLEVAPAPRPVRK